VIVSLGEKNTATIAELDGAVFKRPVNLARLKRYKKRDTSLQEFEIKLNSLLSASESSSTLRGGDNCREFFVNGGSTLVEERVLGVERRVWGGLIGDGII
jgi:hypothetical protein